MRRAGRAAFWLLLTVIAQIVETPMTSSSEGGTAVWAFVVETHLEGAVPPAALHGRSRHYNGEVHLRDVFLPVETALARKVAGLRRALESLTVGRLTLPAACLGY